jgi:predicted glutamine amidotransferase
MNTKNYPLVRIVHLLALTMLFLASSGSVFAAADVRGEASFTTEYHNCRFWGIVSENAPSGVIQAHLVTDPYSIENLSYANPDGWSVGYYPDGDSVPVVNRGEPAAYDDPLFDAAVTETANATARIAVAHVRSCSSGLCDIANPHPFEREKNEQHWLMGHNGTIDKSVLLGLIRPDYLAANPPEHGSTQSEWIDSELYFILVLQTLEDFNWQVKLALGQVIRSLREDIPGTGEQLNMFLTDGTTLWAYREGRSLYYLYDTSGTPYSAVASQYPSSSQASWITMSDGQLVTLNQGSAPVLENIEDYFSFHFTVTADMRGYHTDFGNLLQAINNGPGPGAFHISVGDIDETIPENRAVIDDKLGSTSLWYPIIGNHEAETSDDMTWLRDEYNNGNSLRTALKNFTNQDGPTGTVETTYTWNYGRAHFIVLNEYWNGGTAAGSDVATDGDIVSALYNWLSADLEANTKPLVFIFGHEPAFPQNRHIGDSLDKYPSNRDAFWALLEDEHVQVYFCGHTHFYSKHQEEGGNVWQFDAGNAGNDTNGNGFTYLDVVVSNNRVTVNVYRDSDGTGPGTFSPSESVDTLTWESYSDLGHTTMENTFSGSANHVYMKGDGFLAGTIKVGYYDGGGALRETDTYSTFAGGTLGNSECLFTSYAGVATEGTWHAVVLRQTDDLPDTYGGAIADPDYVSDDDFYVASSAIPEFPTVTTVVVVIGVCAVIYYWIRERYLAHVKA